MGVAVETVEHLENPRPFVRELARLTPRLFSDSVLPIGRKPA